jgi:hypothetical protein
MLLIDLSTGTVLTESTCQLVPDSALSPAEWESLDGMSDAALVRLARERGTPVWRDRQTLDAIASLLNGREWSADTLDTITEWLRATGRTINDI